MPTRQVVSAAILLTLTGLAHAEPHRVIVKDGEVASPAGDVITQIVGTATNGVGGFGVAVNSGVSPNLVSHILTTPTAGFATPAAPAHVRSEGVMGSATITAYEGEFGLADSGSVAYGVTATILGVANLDCTALDDTLIAIERDPAPPFPGQFWSLNSRIRMTHSGIPYWKAGVANTATGATANRGVVKGAPPVKLFAGNDLLPNIPAVLDMTASNTLFRYRMSASGTHYISQDNVDGATSSNDNVMILDGAGLLIDGQLVRDGSPVPVAAGGRNAENWGNFQEHFINETGTYYIMGDTSATAELDHYILANGQMLIRDGDTIDGTVLNGTIGDGAMNESADLAVTWATDNNATELLLLNRRIILREGDVIDLDRTGTPPANYRAAGISGAFGIAVTNRIGGLVRVYVLVDVDTSGTTSVADDTETLLEISVCLPDINRSGAVTVQDIFDFLGAYFANDPAADYNNSFSVSVQDIFDFLAGYFAGCG